MGNTHKTWKIKRLSAIGALAAVCLLLSSVALVSLGTQTVDAATPGYTYSVSKDSSGKTLVKTTNGATRYSSTDSKTAIQWAINNCPSGSTVLIRAGQYTLSGDLSAKAGVTISGEGSNTVLVNGAVVISASNVVVQSLKMGGTCHIMITPKTAAISSIIVRDVSATVGAIEAAFMLQTNSYGVSNVQFIRDTVTNSGSNGFELLGRAQISDVLFDSCKVIASGQAPRFNDWVSGFILTQNAPVKNIKAVNCEASNNWENGFYLRPSVTKTNVVLENCIANNNGQKPAFKEGYGYLLDSSVTMTGSTGTGNKGGLTNLASPPVPPPVNDTKGTSSIALTATASSVQTGNAVHVSGSLKGTSSSGTSSISGATVALKITAPSGTTVNPTQGSQTTTDASGSFAMDYTPTQAGTYTFVATYAGNSAYGGSTASASVTVTSAPAPSKTASSIALSLTSSSIQTGQTLSANGLLSGTSGIAGAAVSVKVTLPDGSTANPTQGATVTTDSAGKFVVSYVPTVAGNYMFTATFAGNTNYVSSSNSVSFSAVAPSTPPTTTSYNYIVSSNVVKTPTGSTAYTGSSFTAALQWACSQANKVTYVPSGTYTVTGRIAMASGATLMGDGESKTVFSFTQSGDNGLIDAKNVNNVVLKQFRITGTGAIRLLSTQGVTSGGHLIQDVTAYYTTASDHEGTFELNVLGGSAGNAVLDGVKIIRCKAIHTGGHGFQLTGDGFLVPGGAWNMVNYNLWIKNVYFEDCLAEYVGVDSWRYNPWVTGFDIVENANVNNVKLVRCTANYNFESGFHLEPMPQSVNVVFQDCTANYNGQKPSNFNNQPWDSRIGPVFGAGFYQSPYYQKTQQFTLINCSGVGNKLGDLYHDGTTNKPHGYLNGDLPPSG